MMDETDEPAEDDAITAAAQGMLEALYGADSTVVFPALALLVAEVSTRISDDFFANPKALEDAEEYVDAVAEYAREILRQQHIKGRPATSAGLN